MISHYKRKSRLRNFWAGWTTNNNYKAGRRQWWSKLGIRVDLSLGLLDLITLCQQISSALKELLITIKSKKQTWGQFLCFWIKIVVVLPKPIWRLEKLFQQLNRYLSQYMYSNGKNRTCIVQGLGYPD